jgi:outer membrane lipoprotein-sorting protein
MTIVALMFVLVLAAWLTACLAVYIIQRVQSRRRKTERLHARIEQIIRTT